MNQNEFLTSLEKHRGKFEIDSRGRIRTKRTYLVQREHCSRTLCPIEILGRSLGRSFSYEEASERLGLSETNLWKIVCSVDNRELSLNKDNKALRKKLLSVLGLT